MSNEVELTEGQKEHSEWFKQYRATAYTYTSSVKVGKLSKQIVELCKGHNMDIINRSFAEAIQKINLKTIFNPPPVE